ncbi:MAG: type I-C CRISPR-associated protein Cas8c/Csd1, partial [Coriobacteriia bacterium]|nr:type I-C CRISPR-associated protein Cas8c/Csd1 [Coriobacteriia bacterium]
LDLLGLIQHPSADVVGPLIESVYSGRPHDADLTEFHIGALSASSARAVVRDWIDTTGFNLRHSLKEWFELQRQVDPWGARGEPLGVWRLSGSAYRDARKEMTPDVPRAIVRTALSGQRLPEGLLSRVVQRCRIEQAVTYERAVLIKMLLASRYGWEAGKMTELDTESSDVAYRCGRLIAVLEDIQHAALGKVGATVIDKYYGAASAAPATVFGRLVGDAQNHLAKIRKERGGLQVRLQERLEEVLSGISSFPRTLTLERQGMFALGYYHERAALRAHRTGNAGPSDSNGSEEAA